MKFYPLAIKDIRQETRDCVSIAFEVPDAVSQDFKFTQGQYLTIKTKIGQDDVRRSYSICSSPLDKELRVAIKQVKNGRFSTYANQHLKTGDILDVMRPMGRFFTELNPTQAKKYLFFAAGSGITPILSIIKTILQTEPQSQCTLFYGNKNRNAIIFKEQIEGLKNQYLQRLRLYHILSRESTEMPLFSGRIDEQKCLSLIEKQLVNGSEIDECFMCGPQEMIESITKILLEHGLNKKNIHFELFASTNTLQKTKPLQTDTNTGTQTECDLTVRLDGVAFKMKLTYGGENILDAALNHGADLPYACKGGVCCTCKAKLVEGKVDMDVNYALEPEEVEAGFILTCQAHPKTPIVVVDFDVK